MEHDGNDSRNGDDGRNSNNDNNGNDSNFMVNKHGRRVIEGNEEEP